MDIKEFSMFNHYKYLIENRLFDEYDVYAFLILIRSHIPKGNFQLFHEYCDIVAHREKEKGIIFNNLKIAKENNYEVINGKVKGYHGYSKESWNNQLRKLLKHFNIKTNNIILKELTICIFCLFQEMKFIDENGILGKLELFFNPDHNQISICTTEGKSNSFLVCLAKIDDIKIEQKFLEIFDGRPAETYRENGILKVRNQNGFICEVN